MNFLSLRGASDARHIARNHLHAHDHPAPCNVEIYAETVAHHARQRSRRADFLAELRSRFNMELTVDLEDDDHSLLYEQWNVEHSDTPVGDRRLSTLSVDASEADAQMIAEAAVDTISPTARHEDSLIRAGERVTMAVDAIP